LQAKLCGVGLELFRENTGETLTVAAVQPGSSAHAEGVRPGNRITFIDNLDTRLLTLQQAKGMLLGAPHTRVDVELSTAPLPPGVRTLSLERGSDELHEVPPKHDFHRQKRPVRRDGLFEVLSHSAGPATQVGGAARQVPSLADLPDVSASTSAQSSFRQISARADGDTDVTALRREYEIQMQGLSAQLRAATEENALLREMKETMTAPPLNAAEREELQVACELLRDIHEHHERTQPQSTIDYGAMVQDLQAENAQQKQSLAELGEYTRKLEAQVVATEAVIAL